MKWQQVHEDTNIDIVGQDGKTLFTIRVRGNTLHIGSDVLMTIEPRATNKIIVKLAGATND